MKNNINGISVDKYEIFLCFLMYINSTSGINF